MLTHEQLGGKAFSTLSNNFSVRVVCVIPKQKSNDNICSLLG